nr:hypothetical protein [Tanacetum cinerariifolium]
LLHSRTTTSDVGEGNQANIPNDSHVKERENFHAVISTHVVNSRAYMGASTRPAKVSPSTLRHGSQAPKQDSVLLNNTTILPRMRVTSLAPRTAETSKAIVENGETSKRNSGYASVPTESTQNGIWWRGSCRSRRVGTDDSMMVNKLPEEINDMKIKVDKVEKVGNGGYSGGWTW